MKKLRIPMNLATILVAAFCSSLLVPTAASAASDGGYLFVTFHGQETPMDEQIYFALSKDGRNWEALNDTQPVLVSQLGEKGVRDPYLLRSHDNKKFFLVATDLSWALDRGVHRAIRAGSKSLVIWESPDLVHWSEPRLVKVAPDDAGCSWAPEAVYDVENGDYLVFWASTTGRDDFRKHRIWAARTKDFKTFGEPFIYIEQSNTVIDTTIIHDGSNYYRFTKDERIKAVSMETSPKLMGPWKDVPDFSLNHLRGYEGSTCYIVEPASHGKPATWCLALDHYAARGAGYEPFVTDDLASGQFTPGEGFTFPFKFRHGSVIPVTDEEYRRLEAAYSSDASLSDEADHALPPEPWGNWPKWGDQGDGTYRNPVLPGDYSDIDCIRVGSDYYAISSTFQYSPGMVILHSKDLVNWTIAGHAINDVTEISPRFNWDRMNGYARGVWAGAIRYHDGKFWVYFGTPDEGYFMTTAKDVAGPWEPLHQMTKERGWDDCCPFWDDDGQGYFVGTHFSDNCKTWLYKLTPDGRDIIPESRILINEGAHREANKLFKVGDTYYHFYSEVDNRGHRFVMMQRAKSITGPYTEKRRLSHTQVESHEPNQGGIVQTEAGDWYFLTHHGHGDWEGRPGSLLPVNWVDGWPVLGDVDDDGIGTMPWGGEKPVKGTPAVVPQSSDDFNGPALGRQWEWNFQPRMDKWSLTERPGFLRLRAFKPLREDQLKTAGNTLTQRSMRTAGNVATLALDISGLADGQVAGLCHYSGPNSTIGVRREGSTINIEFSVNGKFTSGPHITSRKLWLRSTWGLDGLSRYAYSTDGKTFTEFGEPYQLAWGDYRGDRIGIFTYNNKEEAGHIDCDSFIYDYSHTEEKDAANGLILGSWNSQVEFDAVQVVCGEKTVLNDAFSREADGWIREGGDWKIKNGVLCQSSSATPALMRNPFTCSGPDYTVRVRMRKTGGAEGFLIGFGAQDEQNYYWLNLGGWGNARHQLQKTWGGSRLEIGPAVNGSIETDRWYEVRIEVRGELITCFLDDRKIIETRDENGFEMLSYDDLGFGRPLIPDLVADPSIVDINGIFYCYATTDGWGQHLSTSGTPVVWTSRDFVNWSFEGSIFPDNFDSKYWAPGAPFEHNGRTYLFPTLDGQITATVSDSLTGPFKTLDGKDIYPGSGWQPFPIPQDAAIDAEIFRDDDGQLYMFYSRRRVVKLKPDLSGPAGPVITINTGESNYSEGPWIFKRNGIYYYLYTLGGGESYTYAYLMSRESPIGPWTIPENKIISQTDPSVGIYGPGHGCFLNPDGTDDWYFIHLEFGRSSTYRQTFAQKMEFNADGTIQAIKLTNQGIGALREGPARGPNLALESSATASSVRPDLKIRFTPPAPGRTETFSPELALDDSNGTRWMAAPGDANPWFQMDLGEPRSISSTEAYFVKPAAGHAYKLEWSLDGQNWQPYGGHDDVILRSPHRDEKKVRARYLKLTILKGEPGLWEFRVY